MYPRSFLCEEAKIKQRTPLKEELCEIGEEAIWESRFTFFFFSYALHIQSQSKVRFSETLECSPMGSKSKKET